MLYRFLLCLMISLHAQATEDLGDPLVYFAQITGRNFTIQDLTPGAYQPSKGAEYPLWVTINPGDQNEITAQRIANILRQHNFSFQYGDEQKDSFMSQVEQARLILKYDTLPDVKVVTQQEYYKNSQQIRDWVSQAAYELRVKDSVNNRLGGFYTKVVPAEI